MREEGHAQLRAGDVKHRAGDVKHRARILKSKAHDGSRYDYYSTVLNSGACLSDDATGNGWIDDNSYKGSVDECSDECEDHSECGYFAFSETANGYNCVKYKLSNGCKTDNDDPDWAQTFKSYEINRDEYQKLRDAAEAAEEAANQETIEKESLTDEVEDFEDDVKYDEATIKGYIGDTRGALSHEMSAISTQTTFNGANIDSVYMDTKNVAKMIDRVSDIADDAVEMADELLHAQGGIGSALWTITDEVKDAYHNIP